MTLQQRDRLRIVIAVCLILLVIVVLAIRMHFAPMIAELAATQVDNQASNVINEAIDEEIIAGNIDYDSIIVTEKDEKGNVTALRANIAHVNRLKTTILNRIDSKLKDMSVETLGIPVGNIILPELFSGSGPQLPVRVLAVRKSDAIFHNDFEEAGINQTLHRITIEINVTITVLTLTGTQNIEVDSSVVAAETVIVGTVPTTYIDLEGIK